MRRLAIPDAAAVLALHPSEVRALVEDGQLDAVQMRGRWLISSESVERLDASRRDAGKTDAPEADLHLLEARVAELERRLESVERAHRRSARQAVRRPARQPLFQPSD